MTTTLSDHPDFHRATRQIASAPLLTAQAARRRAHRREFLAAAASLAADLLLYLGLGSAIGAAGCWLLWTLCRS